MNQLLSEPLRIHFLIFPAFKSKGKNSSYSTKDTTVYEEISLKIFKELGLQDLCQVKLVCKEWKQLVEESFLDEKVYTLALKLVIQKDKPIKEAFCIEKLGDVYSSKGAGETLLQATGLYNYALRLSSKNRREIIKEKLFAIQQSLLTELCGGEPLSLEQMRKQFEDNRTVLKKIREDIEEKVQALPETPSSEQVRELHGEIAQQIKVFFKRLAMQAFDILGPPPCEYAMIGFGSLAREEITPYSDLEFGILIQEDTAENRKYFKGLTFLIHLRVINLGETILPALNIPSLKAINFFDSITPRGFAFDGAGVEGKGCKTPLGNGNFKLIQTPEKMAQYISKDEKGNWWHEKEPHLPMELLTFTHLLGNPGLTKEYGRKVQENLNMPYQKGLNLRQYLARHHLFQADIANFDPGMGDIRKQGMLFKVKNDFYRFLHLALDRLALLKEVEAMATFARIDKLNRVGIIEEEVTEKLKYWMNIALFMRLKTYSYYHAQTEIMNPLIKWLRWDDSTYTKKQFALNLDTLEKIKRIYRIYISFHQAIQSFFRSYKDKANLLILEEDESHLTQGNIALRLCQYQDARSWYSLADKANADNPEILIALGFIYKNQGKLELAAKYISKTLKINSKVFGENNLTVARDYNNLGSVYQAQGNLAKATEYAKKALAVKLKLFGESNPHVAICYTNLGCINRARGKGNKALEYTNKALEINTKFHGKHHPSVAGNYNNLGLIYETQGNLKKATEYIKKAFEIEIKLYGEYHPKVAVLYNNLGTVYYSQGNLKKAVEYINKALEIEIKIYGKYHPKVAFRYNNLSVIHTNQKKLEKAAKSIEQALKINTKLYPKNHPSIARNYNNLGQIYLTQGNLLKAIEYTKKALKIDVELFGDNTPNMIIGYNNLGQIYLAQGNLKKASRYLKKGLAINFNLHNKNEPHIAVLYNNLAIVRYRQGNLKKATAYAKKAIAIDLKLYGENHPRLAIHHNTLGLIYTAQKKLDKAASSIEQALKINTKLYGENHPNVAGIYNNLGQIYRIQGNFEQASEYATKSLNINLKSFSENHAKVATNYNNLGMIYEEQGKLEEAFRYIDKALKIDLKLFGENSLRVARHYTTLLQIYRAYGSI
ncbi:tetratricopeptide repeat protein [Neochlamydia sp. AcF65]|uniref:tetratricopeptide repeat protein n=1 Tax=Neochlamydia sp. AcF65 TaxID=2795735 RepID=UPI001BC9C1B4|nr:tetratricopeptide repeat protein [Neochlamydia sp. AcF65]